MKFLLDTNTVTGLLRGHPGLLARVRQHATSGFGVSAIVAHELFYGAFRGSRPAQNLSSFDALRFEVLDFDKEDARQAAEIRATLAKAGTPIGPYDVLIAGQARARDLTPVTPNIGEFSRVDGLRAENWEA